MLRPSALLTTDYKVATKPTAGWERQLLVSTAQQSLELGTLLIPAPNSGVYTPNVADNAALATTPSELLMSLTTDLNAGPANVVVTVTGLDQNSAPLSGVATFAVPGYSQVTDRVFPVSYAAEVIPPVDGSKFSVVTTVTLVSTASANNVTMKLWGVPSVSTFRLIGTKTRLGYDLKVPQPHPVQDGRDAGRYIKQGEIPVGAMEITAKNPANSDGLARYNGIRVVGLVQEKKEGKVLCSNTFLMGLVMTAKPEGGESVDSETWTAQALHEGVAVLLAG